MTGSPTIPPAGLPKLNLMFKHGCSKSQGGTACGCLPTASTCAMHLILPVHADTLTKITEGFNIAITATRSYGFGLG